jgi:hypothetical protein
VDCFVATLLAMTTTEAFEARLAASQKSKPQWHGTC